MPKGLKIDAHGSKVAYTHKLIDVIVSLISVFRSLTCFRSGMTPGHSMNDTSVKGFDDQQIK